MVIPAFDSDGKLPPGVHAANWAEVRERFGYSGHRRKLLKGLERALASLKAAGCKRFYLDGSFVTDKHFPKDFDGCWAEESVNAKLLDPVLLKFDNGRAAQKAKFYGEIFPASSDANGRSPFLDFFQQTRTEEPKGIVAIDLLEWEP